MFDEQSIYEVGGLLVAGYGIYQAQAIHDKELERAKQRHQEAIELAKAHHDYEMKTMKQTYLLELFHSLEQHFQQLNSDLIMNSRESERDMFDQRNQSFQIIILSASIMFAALSSIIVAGDIPNNSGKFFLVAYALLSALSFSFLFLSIVFCFELVSRTSLFMYKRGKLHSRSLRLAISDTKKMMRDLRGEGRGFTSGDMMSNPSSASLGDMGSSNSGGLFQREDEAAQRARENLIRLSATRANSINSVGGMSDTSEIRVIRRAISQMQPGEIEAEFDRHEFEIREYMKRREHLNYASTLNTNRNKITGRKRSFNHFWEESCELWWNLAILFFYAGSLSMILVLMIYMWSEFIIQYNSLISAMVGVIVLGLICLVGVVAALVMRESDRVARRRYTLQLHSSTPLSPQEETNSKRRNPDAVREEETASDRLEKGSSGARWVIFRRTRAVSTGTRSEFRDEDPAASSPRSVPRAASASPTARRDFARAGLPPRRESVESSVTTDSSAPPTSPNAPPGAPPRRGAARAALQKQSSSRPSISFLSAIGVERRGNPMHPPPERSPTNFQSIHTQSASSTANSHEGPSDNTNSATSPDGGSYRATLQQQRSFGFPEAYPSSNARRSPRHAPASLVRAHSNTNNVAAQNTSNLHGLANRDSESTLSNLSSAGNTSSTTF